MIDRLILPTKRRRYFRATKSGELFSLRDNPNYFAGSLSILRLNENHQIVVISKSADMHLKYRKYRKRPEV